MFVRNIVGAQLDAITLRNHQRDFQHVYRIQPQPFAVKRRGRDDRIDGNIESQLLDDQCRDLSFQLVHARGDRWKKQRLVRPARFARTAGTRGDALSLATELLGAEPSVIEQFLSDVPAQLLNPAVVVLVDLIAAVLKLSAISIDDPLPKPIMDSLGQADYSRSGPGESKRRR